MNTPSASAIPAVPPAGRLAISNIAWDRGEDALARDVLERAGVGGVEIAPTKVWDDPLAASAADVERYRDLWHGHGLRIVALQSLLFGRPDLRIFAPPADRARTLHHLKGMIDLAARLGAGVVVFGSPGNRSIAGWPANDVDGIAIEFFTALGAAAASEGIVACLEPNPPQYGADFLTTTSEVMRLLSYLPRPGLGLNIDAGALVLADESIPGAIGDAVPWASHFHISEPHLAPIGQAVPHMDLAQALARSAYGGWVSIEMKAEETGDRATSLERAIAVAAKDYAAFLSGPGGRRNS